MSWSRPSCTPAGACVLYVMGVGPVSLASDAQRRHFDSTFIELQRAQTDQNKKKLHPGWWCELGPRLNADIYKYIYCPIVANKCLNPTYLLKWVQAIQLDLIRYPYTNTLLSIFNQNVKYIIFFFCYIWLERVVGNHLRRIYLGLYISNTDVERRGRHGRLLAVIDKRGSVLYVALKRSIQFKGLCCEWRT